MQALATTMASFGSTVVTVVWTTRVSLTATFTHSTLKRKLGPNMNPLSPKHPCQKVEADTLYSHSTTNSTHTVVGTLRPNTTTLLCSTWTLTSGAIPTSTTTSLAGIIAPLWSKPFPHGSTLFSAVRAPTSMKAKPELSVLMSTAHATWILVLWSGVRLNLKALKRQPLVSMLPCLMTTLTLVCSSLAVGTMAGSTTCTRWQWTRSSAPVTLLLKSTLHLVNWPVVYQSQLRDAASKTRTFMSTSQLARLQSTRHLKTHSMWLEHMSLRLKSLLLPLILKTSVLKNALFSCPFSETSWLQLSCITHISLTLDPTSHLLLDPEFWKTKLLTSQLNLLSKQETTKAKTENPAVTHLL